MTLVPLGDRHQSSLSDRHQKLFSIISQLAASVGDENAQRKYDNEIARFGFAEDEIAQIRVLFFAHFILHLTRRHSQGVLTNEAWGMQYKGVAQWMKFWDRRDAEAAHRLASQIVAEEEAEPVAEKSEPVVEKTHQLPPASPVAGEAKSLDNTVEEDIHALGRRIEGILNQFNYAVTYLEELSVKALRVYRLAFKPGLATNLTTIENSSYKNLIGHAGLHPSSRLFVYPGRVEVHVPVDNPEIPMWMAHGPRRLQHCNIKPYDPIDSVEFVCGYNLDGKIHSIPKVQRVLLAGGSGSGKTNSIQLNLVSWHVWYTPDQLRLVLISTDGASLGGFQDSKMLFTPDLFCDEVDTYLPTLKRVLDIRERRRRAFKQAGINTLAQWNACNPRKRLPFIMVVIEEMSDSADEVDALIEQLEDEDPQYKPEFKNANAPVIRLAEVARKQGIGIVIGTQRPAAKSVDPRIKANVDLRAVYRVGSEADSAIAFGIKNENRGFYLQGDGDSFILHKAQFERCQQFLMGATEEEAQHYIKEMVKYHNYQYRDAIPDPDDRFLPPLPQKEDPVRQRYNQYLSLLDKGLSETEVFRQIFSSRYPDEQITGNSLKWCRTQIAKWEETYAEE